RGPAARPEPEGLAGGHRRRAAAATRDEKRLLDLEKEVAALVRRRAVDAEPDADTGVDELAHGRDARAEAEVRGRAMRNAGLRAREPLDVPLREVHAVRAPHVAREPAERVEVLDRRAAVQLLA